MELRISAPGKETRDRFTQNQMILRLTDLRAPNINVIRCSKCTHRPWSTTADHNQPQLVTTDHNRPQSATIDLNRRQSTAIDYNQPHPIATDNSRPQSATIDHYRPPSTSIRSNRPRPIAAGHDRPLWIAIGRNGQSQSQSITIDLEFTNFLWVYERLYSINRDIGVNASHSVNSIKTLTLK